MNPNDLCGKKVVPTDAKMKRQKRENRLHALPRSQVPSSFLDTPIQCGRPSNQDTVSVFFLPKPAPRPSQFPPLFSLPSV